MPSNRHAATEVVINTQGAPNGITSSNGTNDSSIMARCTSSACITLCSNSFGVTSFRSNCSGFAVITCVFHSVTFSFRYSSLSKAYRRNPSRSCGKSLSRYRYHQRSFRSNPCIRNEMPRLRQADSNHATAAELCDRKHLSALPQVRQYPLTPNQRLYSEATGFWAKNASCRLFQQEAFYDGFT